MHSARLTAVGQPQPAPWKSAGRLMLLALLSGAAAFASTLPTWVYAEVSDVLQNASVAVPGSDAAPGVSALALVVLAATVALRLAPQKVRYFIVAVMVAAGAGMIFSVASVLTDPASAAQATIGSQTGVIGMDAQYSLTIWPWASLIASACVIASAAAMGAASRSWVKNKSKYDKTQRFETQEDFDEIDTWDALTHNFDPTDRR
ncbi:Trp biosynthesis-associated membrane protein [Rothia sp. ZJ932]|uniref:Trp biosynthesis-associated membrane protein n=1 Tax=Rothia sp. ZJ932 TaxID=2810516 RepID=UPI001968A329|nr:Trp biosynthesis-associated membrane protein [Rothia sp. ZJ932]QRZ60852.1 Trp biosynthesis-associated membrane protein [Rothia sp. ZJ932]